MSSPWTRPQLVELIARAKQLGFTDDVEYFTRLLAELDAAVSAG